MGTVVITNANYYFGGTLLQSGTLAINGIFALGGANYGGLTFNGVFCNTPRLTGNGSGDLTSIGTADSHRFYRWRHDRSQWQQRHVRWFHR